MLRMPLVELCLQIKLLGLGHIKPFLSKASNSIRGLSVLLIDKGSSNYIIFDIPSTGLRTSKRRSYNLCNFTALWGIVLNLLFSMSSCMDYSVLFLNCGEEVASDSRIHRTFQIWEGKSITGRMFLLFSIISSFVLSVLFDYLFLFVERMWTFLVFFVWYRSYFDRVAILASLWAIVTRAILGNLFSTLQRTGLFRSIVVELFFPFLFFFIVFVILPTFQVGAIEGDEELTPLGQHLAKLPVDVLIGKVCC